MKLAEVKQIISSSKFRNLLFNVLIPAAFFIFAVCFMPIDQVFQFDAYDEGIELIKAALYLKGFAMYTQFWNDQPPLSTVILSFWLSLFGKSILAARLLTLTFSTIFVWSFCQILRLYLGNLAAFIGALLLIISCNFLRLSVSVMFGLPALTLAMLSIYMVSIYKFKDKGKFDYILIIISGILFAISLQIKLFTAFLIPLIIGDLIYHDLKNYPQQVAKFKAIINTCLWNISCLIAFLIISILCNSLSYQQLLDSHVGESVRTAFSQADSIKLTLSFLLQDFDYLLLAVLAIALIWRTKQWSKIFPITWISTAFIVLLIHRPVWYHHYLLISIPMTWLASYGVVLSLDFFRENIHNITNYIWPISKLKKLPLSGVAAIFVIFSIITIPIKLGIMQWENHKYLEQSKEKIELVNLISAHKKSTNWFFTDCPIYAFYADLLVPPEIAVLSQIRIDSKSITREQFLAVLTKYHPEQVLLCKSPLIRDYLNSYLLEHYRKIYESHLGINYLSKDRG
jgi:hypothetical protein